MSQVIALVHRAILSGVLTVCCLYPAALNAAPVQLTQYFPAVPSGQTAPPRESGWRITFEVLEPQTHSYGESAVLEFQSIEFMKGLKADGSEDWIKVLNNLALAEMYVPYNFGAEIFDISGQYGFEHVPTRDRTDFLPKSGVVSAELLGEYVISEVDDDGVRWMDNYQNTYNIRRGQVLRLWATLAAGNYSYTLVYIFSDDGRISVRVGGTAQNLRNIEGDMTVNLATHVHMGAWRMEFDLGDAAANVVEILERERVTDPQNPQSNRARVQSRIFNGGNEGGADWDPTKYTILKITNSKTLNRHNPPKNVSYVLKTTKLGKLKTNRPTTAHDFWVSRFVPDAPNRQAPELKFDDLPKNISTPEPIADREMVIWHNSSLQHIPRGEDFGPEGYKTDDGAAINSYAGFDLVPVNLWHKTPFLDRTPTALRDDERAITRAGPRNTPPAGERPKDPQRGRAPMRATLTEPKASSEGFDGKWQLVDGRGTLEIKGSEWRHPEKGVADLLKGRGSANYEVQYRHHRGAMCTYRIKKTSDGHSLILEPADPTQPVEFCPSGTLLKLGS